MSKFKQPSIAPLGWLVGLGLLGGICYLVWQLPFLGIVIIAGLIFSVVMNWQDRQKLNNLAASRKGESICHFARYFDYRNIDTWVIRAVYEQLQEYVGLELPVRASDRLIEDLRIDPEDLELTLVIELAKRTGRTLARAESNPYYGKVKTVQDMVLFFNAQPKNYEL